MLTYHLDRVFDQLELKWVALKAQKGVCTCGEKVNLSNGQLHHALISRADVRNHPQRERIHHPYNVIVLHDKCHENITREVSCRFLARIYSFPVILEWYNSFKFESNFRKLETFWRNHMWIEVMPWSAYATKNGEPLPYGEDDKLIDRNFASVFEQAAKTVSKEAGRADIALKIGCLHALDCKKILYNMGFDETRYYTPEEVSSIFAQTRQLGNGWAWANVVVFLRILQQNKLGLGIREN